MQRIFAVLVILLTQLKNSRMLSMESASRRLTMDDSLQLIPFKLGFDLFLWMRFCFLPWIRICNSTIERRLANLFKNSFRPPSRSDDCKCGGSLSSRCYCGALVVERSDTATDTEQNNPVRHRNTDTLDERLNTHDVWVSYLKIIRLNKTVRHKAQQPPYHLGVLNVIEINNRYLLVQRPPE